MNTVVQDEIRRDPNLSTPVASAAQLLETELGPSEPTVLAEWRLAPENNGRGLVELILTDREVPVSVQERFRPAELKDEAAHSRLYQVWWRLLVVRNRQLATQLQKLIQGLEED